MAIPIGNLSEPEFVEPNVTTYQPKLESIFQYNEIMPILLSKTKIRRKNV